MQSSASRRCNVGFFQPSEDRALDDGMTFLAAIVDQFVECFRHRFHEPYLAFDLQLFFDGKSAHVPTARGLLRSQCQQLANFRSEEHTSELQSLMRISYAVFCLKKQKIHTPE